MVITRQERERFVLDYYNQGKTYREISKEARISPCDIGVILKPIEEKTQRLKQGHDNNNADKDHEHKQNIYPCSLSIQTIF